MNPYSSTARTNTNPGSASNTTSSAHIPPQALSKETLEQLQTSTNTKVTRPRPAYRTGPYQISQLPWSLEASDIPPRDQEQNKVFDNKASSETGAIEDEIRGSSREMFVEEQMVDVIHNPSAGPRDMTVRVQLEIREDVDEPLEEFSRLKCLGKITEATSLFHDRIELQSDASYLLIQYAEMLISAGDYKSFRKLVYVPDVPKSSADPSRSGGHLDRLTVNFELLRLLSQPDKPRSEEYLDASLSAIYETIHHWKTETLFGSTEVHFPMRTPTSSCIY